MRKLIIILGDQLNLNDVLPADYDHAQDVLWMAESGQEARRVWSHKARLVLFLSAMRHFRDQTRDAGHRLIYSQSDELSIAEQLGQQLRTEPPKQVTLTRPGDWHLQSELMSVLSASGIEVELREDPHFLSTPQSFAAWAGDRKQYRMEFFYREMRRESGYLITAQGEPEGGRWNFDESNRNSFGQQGPGFLPQPVRFAPDATTQTVIQWVEAQYGDHPGDLADFDWPVTREQSLTALDDFIENRLALFGHYQDAMWTGESWLYHSRLAAALNLHLLNPREVIEAAIAAYQADKAPLASVEGFVRQILGWREFVRGLYWLKMPDWQQDNFLDAKQALPAWYWSGDTEKECLRDTIALTLKTGYAHHIQRLMVTGLYALLLGVKPQDIEAWYHAIYVDAVSWVELPNTLGMSQFVDGGSLASKPYIATGAYIDRMSNACQHCQYRPKERHGEKACPFTVLYWDFLLRHEERLRRFPRMAMQLRNLQRLDAKERSKITQQAQIIRDKESMS